ncbi:MAG TPA: hypothetical protein VJ323_02370 [Bryobacteraceae bacterium]|nr:hypothetical protein [Bryobacteraceae bacterium]
MIQFDVTQRLSEMPSSVRGPVDFCAFRRLARRRASEGARRMMVGELGDISLERDGSFGVVAAGFFLEDMNILLL